MVGGAEGVFVRLAGVCSCVALTLGDLRVIFYAPACLARSLGVVAPGFCNYWSGFWGNLTSSVCLWTVICWRVHFFFALPFPATPPCGHAPGERWERPKVWSPLFVTRGLLLSLGMFVEGKEEFDDGWLVSAIVGLAPSLE